MKKSTIKWIRSTGYSTSQHPVYFSNDGKYALRKDFFPTSHWVLLKAVCNYDKEIINYFQDVKHFEVGTTFEQTKKWFKDNI